MGTDVEAPCPGACSRSDALVGRQSCPGACSRSDALLAWGCVPRALVPAAGVVSRPLHCWGQDSADRSRLGRLGRQEPAGPTRQTGARASWTQHPGLRHPTGPARARSRWLGAGHAGARRMTETDLGWGGLKAVATASRAGPGRNDQDVPLGVIR
jgi:hypothetical protein